MEGRVCILYRNGVQLKEKEILGKELTCLLPEKFGFAGKMYISDSRRYR